MTSLPSLLLLLLYRSVLMIVAIGSVACLLLLLHQCRGPLVLDLVLLLQHELVLLLLLLQ